MSRGLVLGKFAPLHRGHQHLIETALASVEELVVLVYDCPDLIDVPLGRRAGWIRALYPRATVLEGWGGPREAGPDPRIQRLQEAYVLGKVGLPVTHFFSSEWYGEHMSRALGARDVRVDPDRRRFPVSGTAVRADPFAHRAWVHPWVYRDLVRRVVFLGAESTGKTTLARALADACSTRWVPEFGREYWIRHQSGGRLTPEQLVDVATGQLEAEEREALEANRVLFADTSALTTALYAKWWHGEVHPRLAELARDAEARYAHVYVCDADMPYVEDGTRAGADRRAVAQREVIADLEARGVPYAVLRGNLEARVGEVTRALERR
jgi:NadR type nicotinamide-nucleotide adenylyltransferase